MTEWRDVEGFPGYRVSDDGRVIGKQGRVLALKHSGREGRPTVTLVNRLRRTNGDPLPGAESLEPRKYAYVHRLVCQAFNGAAPSDRHEVGHLNGDPFDNRSANLAWVTPVENAAHRVIHGTGNAGERNPAAKLTTDNVRQVRALIVVGMSNKAIAGQFGVSSSLISLIRTGRVWRTVGSSCATE